MKRFCTKMFLNYFTVLMYENWVEAPNGNHAHIFDPRQNAGFAPNSFPPLHFITPTTY